MGILLLLLATTSFAGTPYRRFIEVPKNIRANWEHQREVTLPVHWANGMSCTAVRVGPAGEALTNLHCLESCLTTQHAVEEEKVPGTEIVLHKPRAGLFCDFTFGLPLTAGKAEVLHIFGPGWISPRENLSSLIEKEPSLMKRLMEEGFEASGDLALIRLPTPGPCVALGNELSGTLTNLAYPIVARKENGNPMSPIFLTVGTTLLFSQGEFTLDQEDLRQKLPLAGDLAPYLLPGGVLISSVDAEPGASGSPLFTANGSLVALIRSTWKGDVGSYVPWTSQAVNLLEKKDKIRQLVPANDACLIR